MAQDRHGAAAGPFDCPPHSTKRRPAACFPMRPADQGRPPQPSNEGTVSRETSYWPHLQRTRHPPCAARRHLGRDSCRGHGRHRQHGHRQHHQASRQYPGSRSLAPPFFAGIVSEPASGPVTHPFRDIVKIFSSATGTPTGTLRARGSQNFSAVSRLGDDQSFVASAFNRKACVSHLLKFTIDPAGRPAR